MAVIEQGRELGLETEHGFCVGCVYFLEAPAVKLVKIGFASDFAKRVSDLQCGSPVPLELLGVIHWPKPRDLERAIHKKFAGIHAQNEWFKMTDDVRDFILDWCDPSNVNPSLREEYDEEGEELAAEAVSASRKGKDRG